MKYIKLILAAMLIGLIFTVGIGGSIAGGIYLTLLVGGYFQSPFAVFLMWVFIITTVAAVVTLSSQNGDDF